MEELWLCLCEDAENEVDEGTAGGHVVLAQPLVPEAQPLVPERLGRANTWIPHALGVARPAPGAQRVWTPPNQNTTSRYAIGQQIINLLCFLAKDDAQNVLTASLPGESFGLPLGWRTANHGMSPNLKRRTSPLGSAMQSHDGSATATFPDGSEEQGNCSASNEGPRAYKEFTMCQPQRNQHGSQTQCLGAGNNMQSGHIPVSLARPSWRLHCHATGRPY